MRTMYDSVNPAAIPRNAEMVAGYVNGPYKWNDTDWALFPNAVQVGIAVRPSYNGGEVLDVEPGDSTPAQAPDWVLMRRAAGVDPTIYCNESTWPTVVRAFDAAGVVAPHYWIAHYDGDVRIPAGAVAKQYRTTAGWDVSSVRDYWPGVDALITPTKEVFEMEGFQTVAQSISVMSVPCNGARQFFCHIPGANTGEHVDGHLYFVRDTPVKAGASYAGDMTVHIDADRPGPINIPENVRAVTFYYTAFGSFTAWCA